MNIPQYITQLTKDWIKSVSKRLVPGSFIRVEETEDARTISVDLDALKTQIGGSGAGGGDGYVDTSTDQTVAGNKTFTGLTTFGGSVTASGRLNLGSDIFGTSGRTNSLHICAGQTWEHGAHAVFSKGGSFSVVSEAMGSDGVKTAAYYLSGSNQGKLTWGGTTTDSTATTDSQLPTLGYLNDKFSRKGHVHNYAASDHTHSGYALTSHTHSGYAVADHGHAGVYANFTHTHAVADITDLSTTISNAITVYSNTAESTYATITSVSGIDGRLGEVERSIAGVDFEELAVLGEWADTVGADLYDASNNKKFVDTSTAQTVAGNKTFTGDTTFSGNILSPASIKNTGATVGDGTNNGPAIQLKDKNSALYGLIQGRNNSVIMSARKADGTEWNELALHYENGKRRVSRSALAEDYTATNSQEVATCGWTNDKFSRKTHTHNYAASDHTHSGYALTSHTHSGYAVADHGHAGVYANFTHTHAVADITDLSTTISNAISTYSNTAESTYATINTVNTLSQTVDAIDADLSDLSDYVADMDADIGDILDAFSSGQSKTEFVVGGEVTWDGSTLKQKIHTLTFSNGLLTGCTTTTTTIDTPTVITWS